MTKALHLSRIFALFLICLLCVSLSSPTFADFTGRVVGVSDGDTVTVLHDGRGKKIRLQGIDCPEKRQAFGQRAKQFTSGMVYGREVTVREHGRDRYGRIVGEVILPDGTSLNRELVKAGLAWWYQAYSHDRSLGMLEREAREARRGLWIDSQPIPPWCYRKRQRALIC